MVRRRYAKRKAMQCQNKIKMLKEKYREELEKYMVVAEE
jgi:hypothetical protein